MALIVSDAITVALFKNAIEVDILGAFNISTV